MAISKSSANAFKNIEGKIDVSRNYLQQMSDSALIYFSMQNLESIK